ncbi:PvdE, pyoverdine ABC export system, fused ATPase-permease component [Pseudomonas chlororaphis subsp. aurantiaca]|uniref:Cyclic peptide export ABC transporter n=1 Tax=Pseudomonas chlororaphis subsp. aurantiaca TaxID=86192 RepID=A0AAJ0ZHR0_9PSED|nr:cyclic peptide export ABC transporter [Pseudomonas chlororaphis]AZD23416.1 PvdE, pyoverdine ABC export system, fused ATPase-permease component [Pseudomonas chlororaphis subsp. aurantiaca]AZD37097.1 PvdE, pyoverdine ABC export system, fused ATPase-permease component [Pseudomonas chlororaphis subsp. aurantiaca]AZD43436.1 PvdE, pyoverdine ABC export system, fused ATPase-permease component [Pseudomonas chlororaphis subsp. aurantiaca]AZD74570.1 PvdE, pyoverdine ABC export system, fused ATPase-per
MTDPKRGAFHGLLALLRPFRTTVVISVALGMVGGLAITLLLATINNALHSATGMTQGVVLTFAALCLLALTSSIVSDIGTNYVGQRIIAALRKDLGEKVLSAPITQIERYRSHRLIPVLTHDVDTISDFSFAFTPLAIAATVTLGCLGYLAYLSVPMFLMMVVAIIIGTSVQYVAGGKGIRGFDLARDQEDELQRYYNAIASGAKELRMHRPRRYRMNTHRIQETADRIAAIQVRSVNIYILAKTFGSMLFFVVIGLALAMQAYNPNPDPTVITGFVLVLLYMKGPLENLVAYLPVVGKAKIAFGRISELSARFSSPEPHLLLDATEAPKPVVHSLELRGVSYSPPPVEGSEPFHLGPIDLDIKQGDIVFIVGENGCGKTTLIKLLLGLYQPQAGEIRLNGEAVTDLARDDYRQLFTTVFADYYLFDDLVQGGGQQSLDSATQYLDRLEIAHKVSIKDGAFTTTDLSTGQRKRLALVNAWLEGRPVLVFDEWAADQDPAFRRIFYTELLPDLKRLGKTIIVISHDDRYFDIADQLVRLRAGKVVHEMQPA